MPSPVPKNRQKSVEEFSETLQPDEARKAASFRGSCGSSHVYFYFFLLLHAPLLAVTHRFNWRYLSEQFSIKKIYNLQPGDANFIPGKVSV